MDANSFPAQKVFGEGSRPLVLVILARLALFRLHAKGGCWVVGNTTRGCGGKAIDTLLTNTTDATLCYEEEDSLFAMSENS